MDCRGRLEGILAWEWNDPALQAVHFLTVAAYNIQHPSAFTPEAIDGLWRSRVDYLDGRVSIEEIRRRTGTAFSGDRRVLVPASERTAAARAWSRTIASVYPGPGPGGAADRVRAWATSVGQERRPGT